MTIEPLGTKKERRAEILRGVYEDNQKVVNMPVRTFERVRPKRRRVQLRRRVGSAALLTAAVIAVLVGFAVQDLRSEGQTPDGAAQKQEVFAGNVPTQVAAPFGGDAPREGSAPPEEDVPAGPPGEPAGPLNTPETRRNMLPATLQPSLAHLFNLQVRTIVIDPGHGGRDPGAVGQEGTKEKEVTLDVAARLKERLERRYGYRILMTREGDETQTLRARTEFANAHHADLFISIHVNDLPVEEVTSVETYYFGLEGGEEALRLAERENRNADYSHADFREMTQKVGATIKFQESERLARAIQGRMHRAVSETKPDVQDWGVKPAPFMVLLGAEAPSVLAEIACISNRSEEADLRTGAYRERLARALEEGIVSYLNQRSIHPTGGATSDGREKE